MSRLGRVCQFVAVALVAILVFGCGAKRKLEQVERGYNDVERHAKEIEEAADPD